MKNKAISQSGLTLIELAIGMVAIGLLMVAYFQYDAIKQREHLKNLGDYKNFTIADGLAKFRSQHGRLPCPARTNLPPEHPDYGMPIVNEFTDALGVVHNDCNTKGVLPVDVVAPGTCNVGYCVANGTNSGGDVRRVRIGTVPYKVLGIGLEDVIDIHGNQYTYAVVENQASESETYRRDPDFTNHAITVKDYTFDPASLNSSGVHTLGTDEDIMAEMVFFSHGQDGAGSVIKNSVVHPEPCPTGGVEAENCNNDAVFVTEQYAFRSPSAGTSDNFDDNLVYDLRDWLYIWDAIPDDTKSVYTLSDGKMGVGIEQSTEKVHISGNLRVDMLGDEAAPDTDMGKIQTEVICDQTKGDCFSPEHLGGEEKTAGTLYCDDPDNFPIMRGVKLTANADVKARQLSEGTGCTSPVGSGTDNCDDDGVLQFMSGMTVNATTGEITRKCDNIL